MGLHSCHFSPHLHPLQLDLPTPTRSDLGQAELMAPVDWILTQMGIMFPFAAYLLFMGWQKMQWCVWITNGTYNSSLWHFIVRWSKSSLHTHNQNKSSDGFLMQSLETRLLIEEFQWNNVNIGANSQGKYVIQHLTYHKTNHFHKSIIWFYKESFQVRPNHYLIFLIFVINARA